MQYLDGRSRHPNLHRVELHVKKTGCWFTQRKEIFAWDVSQELSRLYIISGPHQRSCLTRVIGHSRIMGPSTLHTAQYYSRDPNMPVGGVFHTQQSLIAPEI